MTQASIAATDTNMLLYAHPGVALGALGMLAAAAAAADLSASAGLADPALAALVSAAVGVAALLTFLTTQRFIRRHQTRA